MATMLKLVLGSTSLDLLDSSANGFVVESVDLGAPGVREVLTDLPGQDGQHDDTGYFGSRTVQISGSLTASDLGDRVAALDAIAPFLNPMARPTLHYALDSSASERCLDLRVMQFTEPVTDPTQIAFSYSWKCTSPIAYSPTTQEKDIAISTGSAAGRTYPLTFPRTYPTGGGVSSTIVTSLGTYASWPVYRIFGPAENPAVAFYDSSGSPLTTKLKLTIVIADGDYIEVDTAKRTVTLNGDASRYDKLDFTNTTWGPLLPGANYVRCTAFSSSSPALCQVRWQDAFIR